MSPRDCPFYSLSGTQPVCQVVAQLTDRPLSECHTNDAACEYCLKLPTAPQVPNQVVASMAIHVAKRTNDDQYLGQTLDRFRPFLKQVTPPPTLCVLRGPETRKVACKPCQADSLTPVMVPVFACPKHKECTLHNTGTFPKIKACATCDDRLEKYYQLDTKPLPAPVLTAIAERVAAAKGQRGVLTPLILLPPETVENITRNKKFGAAPSRLLDCSPSHKKQQTTRTP